MAVDITTLNTNNWQHKAGTFGDIVTDLEDIGQCYETIIGLTKGDVPYQPNLGANIIQAIGENPVDADRIIRALLMTELPKQEPRGKIKKLETGYNAKGQLFVRITYRLAADETQIATKEVIIK